MKIIRVGIEQEEICYLGTLDTVNKVPSDPNIEAVYVDLFNGRFVVALKSELVFLDKKELN